MKRILKNTALLIAAVLSTYTVFAQDASKKGLEIALKADESDAGFESSFSKLRMILTNQHGQTSTRHISTQTLEVPEEGDKSLIVFESPKDVKGTATLTYTHKEGPDDQWLFLPAINRVKRISSSNKSGPFMGSEFAYEDLSSQEVEKYTYKYIGEERLNGAAVYKVERYPVDPKSGYTKQIVYFNQKNYRTEKIEFFDRKNSLLKTLTYHGYQLYLNKFWRADEMLMINHQTNKKTRLVFEGYDFKIGLSENDFTQNSLKRSRI